MNQLEYLPGIAGQSVQLDGPSAFVGIAEEMRSREWDYDLGYRDLVTATRPARTVDVTFHADYDTADTLRRVADADVMARTPGTFVAQNEWKQRGYILASDVDDIHYGRLSTGLKIALLDGAWWRLAKRSFVPEITTPEYRSATGETVTASGASGAPLHALTVDGKAVQDGTPTPSAPVPVEVVQSINLLDINGTPIRENNATYSVSGNDITVTATSASGWSYTAFQFAAAPGQYTISFATQALEYRVSIEWYNGNTRISYAELTTEKTKAVTIPSGCDGLRVLMYARKFSTGSVGDSITYSNVQVERGSTAKPYTPYGSIGLKVNDTITPIDLQGNVLASLPSGIKDELTIDASGHRVIKKRTVLLVYDGSEDESWAYESAAQGNFYIETISKGTAPNSYGNNILCNYATAAPGSSVTKDHVRIAAGSSHYLNVALGSSLGINTAADFKTWLASNNLYVLAPLETEQEIDLGTIDMPAVPLDAQISVTATVTPNITAEWQISRDAYLDYPHNYEYDYQKTSSTGNITPSVLTPSDVYLAVFGPAVNPYVIVGGNRYQVNVTVPSGGYLVVDGRDKTIQLTLADGTVQNVFSSGVRGGGAGGGSYIFERVPAGISEVTYDGSFGFDLGWYEEEGEPPWSQS